MLQPYDPCPCGSGKKFKWCCQSFYNEIQQANEQFDQGQIEIALRLIDDVIKAHPTSTEALGAKAQMLANSGQAEQADEVLEQAFAINPNYPNGLLMRAQIRLNEGESTGAALLARRAAEVYDPAARGNLHLLYRILFQYEMNHQRIIAAHTALSLAVGLKPEDEEVRNALEGYFHSEESPFIPAARKTYTLRRPAANDTARRARWDAALPQVPPMRLGELANLCQEMANADDKDAPAWYNLALARAWLGDNAAALAALDRYFTIESDFEAAREAATLGEVLRLSLGTTEQCDYLQHGFAFQFRDPNPISELLNEWGKQGRLLVQPNEDQSTFSCLILDLIQGIATSDSATAGTEGAFAAYMLIEGPIVRVRGPRKESIDQLRDAFRAKMNLPPDVAEVRSMAMPFNDLVLPALLFPASQTSELTMERAQAHARRYFEETWLHRPLRSLAGNSPIDAVGSSQLKPRVAGVVDFVQQCCTGPYLSVADFNRLRHKLGLDPVPEPEPKPEAQTPGTPAPAAAPASNIPGMNNAELAALNVADLTLAQLDQAQQTALRLKAGELAKHFIEAIVARPAETDRNDRYNYFSYLILRELADGEPSKALELVASGAQFDAAHNDGQRRDEFDLRQAQVLAKQGDTEKAGDTLRTLFERSPEKAKLRIEAIETLLRLKKGKLALELAQAGLNVARERSDGDSVGAFEELSAAARKTPG